VKRPDARTKISGRCEINGFIELRGTSQKCPGGCSATAQVVQSQMPPSPQRRPASRTFTRPRKAELNELSAPVLRPSTTSPRRSDLRQRFDLEQHEPTPWIRVDRESGNISGSLVFDPSPEKATTAGEMRAAVEKAPTRELSRLRAAIPFKAKLELELIQSHMAQKPMLRGEVGTRVRVIRACNQRREGRYGRWEWRGRVENMRVA